VANNSAILLDFSNTITTVESENESIGKWLDLIKERYNIKEDVNSRFKAMRLEKLVDREKRFRTFMEINKEVLSEIYGISEIFEEEYYASHEKNLRLRSDFIPFITQMVGKIKIIMVTDADNVYTQRTLAALKIAQYFDSIVTAENVGAPKPNHKIFNEALNIAQHPSKVLFIGDSERRDIEGAKSMKFFTVKMDDDSSPTIADEIVHNFSQVTEIIKRRHLL
jgi:putative hydrolase of the HAD superfamily